MSEETADYSTSGCPSLAKKKKKKNCEHNLTWGSLHTFMLLDGDEIAQNWYSHVPKFIFIVCILLRKYE
jgi:hypothetical protein